MPFVNRSYTKEVYLFLPKVECKRVRGSTSGGASPYKTSVLAIPPGIAFGRTILAGSPFATRLEQEPTGLSTLGAREPVPGYRHKMALCSLLGYQICKCVHSYSGDFAALLDAILKHELNSK